MSGDALRYVRLREGVVTEILAEGFGFTEATVTVKEPEEGSDEEGVAIAYHGLTGPLRPGDAVTLNTTAARIGLGTGGVHFVVAVHGRSADASAEGHIMKVRYTPSQVKVLSVEEEASPHRQAMASTADLKGTPVAVGGLHSQAPIVAAAFRAHAPSARIAYVMTDAGALPAAFSRTIPRLKQAGIVDTVITAGHAFGGDLEAVTVPSAMQAAVQAAGADAVIVAMGPGVVGTGTPLGATALEQGPWLDAAKALGGLNIAVARASFADRRTRHNGISHHTMTALARFARESATVPLPLVSDERAMRALEKDAETLRRCGHEIVWLDGQRAYAEAKRVLDAAEIAVTSMGRGDRDDPVFFCSAAVAGKLCFLRRKA